MLRWIIGGCILCSVSFSLYLILALLNVCYCLCCCCWCSPLIFLYIIAISSNIYSILLSSTGNTLLGSVYLHQVCIYSTVWFMFTCNVLFGSCLPVMCCLVYVNVYQQYSVWFVFTSNVRFDSYLAVMCDLVHVYQ